MSFPPGFVWGAATASYQIEGAAAIDGRGPSVWDMLARKPGAIWQGHDGSVADDHYHRFKEDVGLMRELGLKGYRFSVAWPRVLPEGVGRVNEKGLEFYDQLVDELLAANIEPWLTVFHWDYPLALYHRGGWLNPDSPKWFADYTAVLVDRLSDRVTNWFTINEPQVFIGAGHQDGRHAPGDKLAFGEVTLAAHHVLLAHGLAAQTIRARAKKAPKVGIAPVAGNSIPASNSPQDIEAARKHAFSVKTRDMWQNTWWWDPLFFGKYPEDGLELFGADAPKASDADMKTICQPMDFLGVNIYYGSSIQASEDAPGWKVLPFEVGHPQTAFRWFVTPEALYWTPRFFFERYHSPIIVTENGLSNQDWIALDGKVHDPQRIDFLQRYLREMGRAIDDGTDVQGYFQWSLLDNFEWAEGYKERFGLVYVDYRDQTRIPKDSFYWYKQVIASNGGIL